MFAGAALLAVARGGGSPELGGAGPTAHGWSKRGHGRVRLDVANPMQGSTSTDAGRRRLRTRQSDSAAVACSGERARGKEKGEEANQGHH